MAPNYVARLYSTDVARRVDASDVKQEVDKETQKQTKILIVSKLDMFLTVLKELLRVGRKHFNQNRTHLTLL